MRIGNGENGCQKSGITVLPLFFIVLKRGRCISRRGRGKVSRLLDYENAVGIEDCVERLVLRQRCSIVKDPTSDEMQTFAVNLMFTCVGCYHGYPEFQIQNNAFGVSAPQVYKPVRLFVTRDYHNVPDPCTYCL